MNIRFSTFVLVTALLGANYAADAQTAPLEDFKPSTLNQPGQEYPQVNHRVMHASAFWLQMLKK